MAFCFCHDRSESRQNFPTVERQCLCSGGATYQATFRPGEKFWEPYFKWFILCAAFGVTKSRTTPYHPMGDGLVERMNRSLLNLLRTYTDSRHDWEEHLQLLLFFYRTTRHSVTGLSPYEVLFGSNPPSLHLPTIQTSVIPDPSSYSIFLQRTLLELHEMVEANIIEASDRQCNSYNNCAKKALSVGQHVLLTNPTCVKLDPRWTGPWTITRLVGPTTVTVQMGKALRTVHVNRLRPFLNLFHHHSQDPQF